MPSCRPATEAVKCRQHGQMLQVALPHRRCQHRRCAPLPAHRCDTFECKPNQCILRWLSCSPFGMMLSLTLSPYLRFVFSAHDGIHAWTAGNSWYRSYTPSQKKRDEDCAEWRRESSGVVQKGRNPAHCRLKWLSRNQASSLYRFSFTTTLLS